MNSPLPWLAPGFVALLAATARWLLQGSGNVYTDLGKQRYVPDPDLGWRLMDTEALWLGLDVVAAIGCTVLASVTVALVLRRRSSTARWPRRLLLAAGCLCLVAPTVAFIGGQGPHTARDVLPDRGFATAEIDGIRGSLTGLPAGLYELQSHRGSTVVASVTAGGETFEARFAGGAEGVWRGAPAELAQPMSARVSFASNSVDTGITLRSKHAREALEVATHARVSFRLSKVIGTEQQGPDSVSFVAEGVVQLLGREHPVHVRGEMRAPDESGRQRLGFAGRDVLLVQAATSLLLSETALADDDSFDADTISLDVSLLFVRAGSSFLGLTVKEMVDD